MTVKQIHKKIHDVKWLYLLNVKDILLQFFSDFKAHTISFSVRSQHKPHFVQELFSKDCDCCMEFSEIMLAWQDDNPNLLKNFCGCLPIKTKNT
jgi:hypothetical protein